MDTVVVELHDSDELGDMPLAALQRQLAVLRSTRSRLDGQEAAVHSAVRRLRETARRDSKGSGRCHDGGGAGGAARSPSDELPLPDAGPTPGPSRKERNRLDARARRLEAHPEIAAALAAGRISTEQADAIMAAALTGEVKRELLSGALEQSTDETLAAVREATRRAQQGDADKRLERQRARRRLRRGINDEGMYWFNGEFDPVVGAQIKAELDHELRRQWQLDKLEANPLKRRTPQQLEADAFVAVMLRLGYAEAGGQETGSDASASGDLPNETAAPVPGGATGATPSRPAGSRPEGPAAGSRVNVTLTLDDLAHLDDRTRRAFTIDGVGVPLSVVQRALDDAEILLWLTDDTRKRYQLIRAQRLASPIQRQALAIRDGRCVWRGCDADPARCDAHHLRHREHGGPTAVDNLGLLCPRHHRQLHRMGAHLVMGETAADWRLVQDHTDRVLDEWTNPPPPGNPSSIRCGPQRTRPRRE